MSQAAKSEIEKVLGFKCGMVAQWKTIEKVLLHAGLAYEQRFPSPPTKKKGYWDCHSEGLRPATLVQACHNLHGQWLSDQP